MDGLRERKKQQTRRMIADTASRLFAERGFDSVTLDEVAHAAEVARRTVVNYFPAKEDLVLERITESTAEMLRIVRDRPAAISLVAAFRDHMPRLVRDHAARRTSLSQAGLIALVQASPALQRAIHANRATFIRQFAVEVGKTVGTSADDPVAATAAAAILGAHRALTQECDRRRDAGEPLDAILASLQADIERVFNILEHGFAGYGCADPATEHLTPTAGPDPEPR